MPAGSIVIDLLMKTGAFETDTKRAEKALQSFKKEAAQIGTAVGAALVGAGTAAVALAKRSIDAADQLSKASQVVGITTESLSGLGYAAKLSGSSQDDLIAGLKKLSRIAADAAGGNETLAASFKQVGVSLRDANGNIKGSDVLLGDLAEKFAGYEDGLTKTALAQEFFGKAGADLIPFLNNGRDGIAKLTAEAARLGVVIGGDTANAAADFNDTLDRLLAVGKGVVNQIAAALLPALSFLAKSLFNTAGGASALKTAVDVAVAGVKILASVGAVVVGVFKTLGQSLGGVAATIVQLFSGNFRAAFETARGTVADFAGNIRGTIGTVSGIWNATADSVERAAPRVGGKLAAPVIRGKEKIEKVNKQIKDVAADIEREIVKLAARVASFGFTDSQVIVFDLQLKGASPEQIERAKLLTAELDRLNAAREASDKAAEKQREIEQELKNIYTQTRSPIEALNIELARLAELRKVAGADQDALARAEFEAWEKYDNAVRKATGTLDEFTRTAAQNVQNLLANSIEKIFSGSFDNIFKDFAKLVKRMAAEALAANIARNLFGEAAGGQGGGLFGRALSAIGRASGSSSAPARANGGPVQAGQAYTVGENGPERFVPTIAGRILPTAQAGDGGGVRVTVNNYAAADVRVRERDDGQIDIDVLARAVEGRIASNINSRRGPMMQSLRGAGLNPSPALARTG
jgi:hypothetical protein